MRKPRRIPPRLTGQPKGATIYDLPPEQRAPGIFRKARNFAKAATKHMAAGAPQASDEQVAERFAICQACELFKPIGDGSQQGTCTHPTCGCKLKSVGLTGLNKLRWAEQACPIGRWAAIPAHLNPRQIIPNLKRVLPHPIVEDQQAGDDAE